MSKTYLNPKDNLWIEDRECQNCEHFSRRDWQFGPHICRKKLMGVTADMRVVHIGPDTSCFTERKAQP